MSIKERTPVAISSDSYFFEKDKSKSILIIGVGNYLMGDEGIGVHVIQEMDKKRITRIYRYFRRGYWWIFIAQLL